MYSRRRSRQEFLRNRLSLRDRLNPPCDVTADELAKMHPLVRAAIAAASRDPHPARALSALLNAAGALIRLEQTIAKNRSTCEPIDGDARADRGV